MDYKTNILKTQIEVKDDLLQGIKGLVFGMTDDGVVVFDATHFAEEAKMPMIDHRVFMRTMRQFIETIARSKNVSTTKLFYQNTDGHILISSELTFIYLMFVSEELMLYFNNIISDAVSEGVAYSNDYVLDLAVQRLPTDILEEIIKSRRNGENREQT